MGLPYVAAEYFIEALKKSSTFCISYDDINTLISKADKVIASYLKKESKNDILFIFKKFPDVFILSGDTVSLTDPFLSLYAFPSSVNFSATYECANAFETAVVEYFKLILSRTETFHYVELFNMLLTNRLELSEYYSHYTAADMYSFYQAHSNTFTILKNNVYLKINPSVDIKSSASEQKPSSKCLKKLQKCTHFLLSCFSSLHYIELKQCIAFVLNPVKEFLNKHSLIKQRETFENFSETSMDKWGYLSLNNFSACMPKSRKIRLIILIVCILAFEREMHFEKLVHEVKKRTSTDVCDSLCRLSISEQFRFFKSFSEFFVMGGDGYVSLLSSFIFPLCSFENPTVNLLCSQKSSVSCPAIDKKNSKSLSTASDMQRKIQNSSSDVIDELQNDLENLQTANNVQSKVQTTDSSNSLSTQLLNSIITVQSSSNIQPKYEDYIHTIADSILKAELQNFDPKCSNLNLSIIDQKCLPIGQDIINIRMKLSIIFLRFGLLSPNFENILRTCLYVLDDIRITFCKSMPKDQRNFILEYKQFFYAKSNNELIYNICSESYVNERERTLLFIVYILFKEGYMHYLKLSEAIISTKFYNLGLLKKICDPFIAYFQEMDGYLRVLSNGCIRLNESFYDINSVIQSHLTFFSIPTVISTNKKTTVTFPKNELLNASKSINTIIAHIENKIVPNGIKPSYKSKTIETELSLYIWKRLGHLILYIQKYCMSLVANNILETFLHSLTDVRTYFSNLSTNDQHRFIEKYFQLINNELIEIPLLDSGPSDICLTEDEKVILLVTYILIKGKSLHYEYIVKKLKEFKITCSLCSMKSAKMFKYFKTLEEFFVINSDGFVCLSSSFFSVSSVINSVSAFNPEIQKKLKSVIKIKNSAESCLEKKVLSSISSKSSLENFLINIDADDGKTKLNILNTNAVVENTALVDQETETKICSVSVTNPEIQQKLESGIKIKNSTHSYLGKKPLPCISSKSSLENIPINLHAGDKKTKLNSLNTNAVVENTAVVGHKTETKICSVIKNEDVKNSSSSTSSNEVIDVIVDVCFSILSTKRMQVEMLCNRLNSCDIKIIQNYFSFFTVAKKMKFFADMPQYFDVSRDGFVSLKENAISSHVGKTNLVSANGTISESEVVNSCNVSELSETFSCKSSSSTNKSNQSKKKKTRRKSKNNPPEARNFTIHPQALTNIKTFLNSGNSTKKFQSSWTIKCSSETKDIQNTSLDAVSQDASVKSVTGKSFSSQNLTCQESNFCKTNSTKELQPNSFNPAVFQFGTTSEIISDGIKQSQKSNQPFEMKLSSKSYSRPTLKAINSHIRTKNTNSNIELPLISGKSFSSQNLTCQEFNFCRTNSTKELQPNSFNPAVFQFGTTSEIISDGIKQSQKSNQPFEMKLSSKSYSRPTSKAINSHIRTKNTNSNIELPSISLSALRCNDLPHGSELIEDFEKCVLKEETSDSLKIINENSKIVSSTNIHNLPVDCGNHNTDSKDIQDDFYETYGTELLNSFLGELTPNLKKTDSSHINKSVDVIELQAVNFFCVILGNYDIGVSSDFLLRHLNLASAGVQTFMLNRFKNNTLSFFLKHKKAFYVSPQTNNVYLVTKD